MKRFNLTVVTLAFAFSSCLSATAELIGYWDFESDFTDRSGNGNDGTAVGNVTLDNSTAAAGDQSMNLANVDDSYLSINDGAGGMQISEFAAFTISIWVNSSIIQDDKRIFSESSSTDNDPLYNLGTGSTGAGTNQADFYHRLVDGTVTNNHLLSVAEPFGDGTWHHLALVDDSGTVDLYIDGVLDSQFTHAFVSLQVNTTTFGAIQRAATCCGFAGNLDDIAVWDQALDAGQIAVIAARSVSPPDLVVPPVDSDRDGMRDTYEQRIIDALPDDGIDTFEDVLPDDDFDMDNSTNGAEEVNRTDPTDPDSDDDGAEDGAETNTGRWLGADDRGTDPLDPDSDGDDLPDGVENPDLPYVDAMQPGTDPNKLDTDNDGFPDGTEIANGTDPTDANDPGGLPTLSIDFNSTTQDGGPHPQGLPYQDYNAGHEVAADFTRQTFGAFDTSVGITPSWPDSTDNRTMQMIDRGSGNDNQWLGTSVNLLTDWLGVDTRTGNGGNGNYDGVTGIPTPMHLTLDGLPGGSYQWTSYHHDTENIHAAFLMEISTDGGTTFDPVGRFQMTSSSTGGNPANPAIETGPDPQSLSSTVRHDFTVDGTADVVLRFIPLSELAVHRQLFGINGFDLVRTSSDFNKFAITSIVHDLETDMITLTFPSTPGQVFAIDTSLDLKSWPGDIDDGLQAAEDADETSYSFPADSINTPGNPAPISRIFFRVRILPN